MSDRFFVVFYLIVLCGCINITAQDTKATEPLVVVLEALQERYDVQFNYASALVDDLLVSAPTLSMTLGESVSHLRGQTDLKFSFVSDRIISIKKNRRFLCGYLKDMDNKEPLPYVTVQNGTRGTITDEQGFFKIEFEGGTDIIYISHIGHKIIRTAVQYLKTTECAILYLVPNQLQLAEVVLYDYLIRGVDKLDNGALQIDFNKFSILPGLIEKDALYAVQALPGIQSIDETVSNINIRGGSNDQNLISWDGIKMYQSGHFFGLISMYNPQITQKVVLRKNGSGADETDGVSGTIAMETEDYLNSGLKGSIGLNLIDGNGYVDLPIGQKASLQMAARKSIGDFVETPTYSEYFNRIAQDTELHRNTATVQNSDIAFDFYDVSFRLLVHPSDKDRIQVNFIYTANEVLFNENATISGNTEIRESNLDQKSIAGGIQYHRNWTDKWNSEIAIYETDYSLKAVNANILEDQRFQQENKVSETSIKLKVRNTIDSQISFTHGYQLTETKVTNLDDLDTPRFTLLEGEVLRTHSLFTQMALSSKNADTQLNVGVRFNYLDKFIKKLWEPRLSINHSFGGGFNIEVLGEYKHQSTSQVINFQNDFLGVEKRRWQLTDNDSIPVMRSKQASVGLTYNHSGWLVNAVPYYKRVDGITTQSQGFQDRYEFVRSQGAYNARGVDLLLRKQLKKSSAWLSYSYLNSDYIFDNLPESRFRGNFDITHALSFGANYTLHQFLFAAGLNWRTGKPMTRPIPNNEVVDGQINFGDANAAQQTDYLRLDVSGKYEFAWGENTRAQIGLAVWNVLDRDNTINTYYRADVLGAAKEFRQSALGFIPNASFRLIFN